MKKQKSKPKVKVFTSSKVPNCLYCLRAKDYLELLNLKYKEIDISKDRIEASRMFKKTSSLKLPQIEIDDKILVGFNKKKLNTLLSEKIKISP